MTTTHISNEGDADDRIAELNGLEDDLFSVRALLDQIEADIRHAIEPSAPRQIAGAEAE